MTSHALHYPRKTLNAIKELASTLEQQKFRMDFTDDDPENIIFLLPTLEAAAATRLIELDRKPPSNAELEQTSFQFPFIEVISKSLGIDYDLQLVRKAPLLNSTEHRSLLEFIISLPGRFSSEGVERENHGFGYHIHYVVSEKRTSKRTNVLLTFNPKEPRGPQDKLYWEPHGSGVKREPDRFRKRRRSAIYDTSRRFLDSVPKSEFKRPNTQAEVLWPE